MSLRSISVRIFPQILSRLTGFFLAGIILCQTGSVHAQGMEIQALDSVLQNYMINLNRVFIEDAEYRILTFDSINERKNFEDRISNLHNALEYGGVAVIITNEEGIIISGTSRKESRQY